MGGGASNYKTFALECGTPYSGTQNNICFHGYNIVISSNTDTFIQDVWHQCVITYEGGGVVNSSTMKFYIDGIDAGYEIDFGSDGSALDTTNANYKFGQRVTGTDLDFNGKLGTLLVYNRALSSTEVKQNYNAGKDRYT